MKDIAVILPTLNEENAIGAAIAGIKQALPDAKIIIADDGSTDGTKNEVAKIAGAGGKAQGTAAGASVVFFDRKNEQEKGLCASVLHAIQKYPHEFYIVMDADGQHPANALPALAAAMQEGTVVVMKRANAAGLAPLRLIISIGATALAKMRLFLCGRAHVSDPMSGFFGIDGKTAIAAMERGHFAKAGFKVLLDFLKSAPAGTKIAQVPYGMGTRGGGASKFGMRHVIGLLQSVLS